ncbi:hypothetical protein [Caldinitratiruptor microaerophilus]|uniref:Uncharacterized protein n=1 Tax=Caldinitratiruptor microaerophilus TaxID=671077 RepID=A0AA35CKA8_9FIRM|nr:hypothetical protein [Caldinitratiruptor microaerophilus]BDG59978.1 hypothetical protein caldi_10680 [Caldinitratiruptor microaerophilus]
MRLGVELVARSPTRLGLGSFFETWLMLPAGVLRRSLGRDEYHLPVVIQAGRRLAGTGRTYICQIDAEAAGLGPNQARPCLPVPVPLPAGSQVVLGLRTNVFRDLPALVDGVHLVLRTDLAEPVSATLDDPRLVAEEMLPGRYRIGLGRLLPAA